MRTGVSFRKRVLVCLTVFIVGIVISLQVNVVSAQSFCLNISKNLSYGQTDQVARGPILDLQNYLQSLGFLNAVPNGHFGPSTLAGVKTYQKNNHISVTGYVGPLTRASLAAKTCGNKSAPAPSVATTSTVPGCALGAAFSSSTGASCAMTTSQPVVTTTSNIVSNANDVVTTGITSPITGQVLSTGSSTVIRWSNPPSGIFNITLEQPGGVGAGFVAMNLSPNSGLNQYVWKVGAVYSSQTNSNITIAPGTYRLRLQSATYGASSNDEVSGWFTVTTPQFTVSSIVPSSGYADNASSVVLFGAGFTSGSAVYFDSDYSNVRANNQYVSPDGSILVFTIPTAVPAGVHTLYIHNSPGSNPVTISFTINAM